VRAACALMLLLSSACAAAESPEDFAYSVPLQTEGSDALYEAQIPASVYRGVTRRDLGDVRVFNSAGEPVPFALEPRPERRGERPAPTRVKYFPLYGAQTADLEGLRLRVERAGGGTVLNVTSDRAPPTAERRLLGYLIEASDVEQPYETLELDWRQQESSSAANVKLEASEDLKTWSVVLAQSPLVRIDSNGERLEQRTLDFAPRRSKYLRLSWPQAAKPIDLTAATVRAGEILREPDRVWLQASPQDATKPGEYLFDLGGPFPIDRLRLALPQDNTIARVELLSRSDPKQGWQPVTGATVYRLTRQGEQVVSPDLAVAGAGDRYWLVRVDQRGGGLGSGVLKLSAGWVPQKLVFAARGAGPFQIAYGSTTAQPASYPIETVVPGWRSRAQPKLAAAQVLPERLLAGKAALQPKRDYKIWGLWTVLVAAVFLLAWMAWRLAKQMQAPGSNPGDQAPPAS